MRHNRSMVLSMRLPHALAALLALGLVAPGAAPAAAQEEVKVKSLAAPDYFSGPAADTGLPADLWKDTAPDIMRDVLPKLAGPKPLSPAFASLARRLLSTGANGPAGVGDNIEMGAQRALALVALGEAKGANAILDRAVGAPGSSALSMATAEAALIAGDDDKACRVQDALTVDRGAAYWLRLRAFCQLKAGQGDAAQLTFQLAQQATKDTDYARLMGAALAGTAPGAANLKNGVNYALSRRLNLDIQSAAAVASASPALKPLIKPRGDLSGVAPGADLTAQEASDLAFLRQAKTLPAFIEAAQASAASVAALAAAGGPLQDPVLLARAALAAGDVASAQAIRGRLTADAIPGATPADLAVLDALIAAAQTGGNGGKIDSQVLGNLVARGASGSKPAQAAAVLLSSLGGTMDADARAQFAAFDLGRPAASAARVQLLEDAGAAKRKGEAGLLALSIAVDGGAAGPQPVDRARIARALDHTGLSVDARAIVVEGLLGLAFAK